jgi:hypothetical protein
MQAAPKRGSRIGRPRTYTNADQIRALRAQDVSWRVIAKQPPSLPSLTLSRGSRALQLKPT